MTSYTNSPIAIWRVLASFVSICSMLAQVLPSGSSTEGWGPPSGTLLGSFFVPPIFSKGIKF